MVKLSKLYTRGGDDGTTGLLGNKRVSKSHLAVEAYGTIDELNSWIGFILSASKESHSRSLRDLLEPIQQQLFDIGAELATPEDSDWKAPCQITEIEVSRLEDQIDNWTKEVGELKSFLLPGGSMNTASLHIARTVCRRAERIICALHEIQPIRGEVLMYVNRLSDWLFALARKVAQENEDTELLWNSTREKE